MMPTATQLTPNQIWARNTGFYLRKVRLEKGLLIKEAALKCKMKDWKVLSRVERGLAISEIATYRQIADGYGISYKFLSAAYTTLPTHAEVRELDRWQAQLESYKKSGGRINMVLGKQLEFAF